MNKIQVMFENNGHKTSYTFHLNADRIITDVYLSSKTDTTGFADFISEDFVPDVVKKAVKIMLEEGE